MPWGVFVTKPGIEISSSREHRGTLNFPAAPSNFCSEHKYVLFDIHNTFIKLMNMQLGSLKEILILAQQSSQVRYSEQSVEMLDSCISQLYY